MLRLAAIGRKNWMFLGSDKGGETAAINFSILANAKPLIRSNCLAGYVASFTDRPVVG